MIEQTRGLQCLPQVRNCDEVDLWSTTRTAATPKNQPRSERAARRLQRESDSNSDSDAPAAKRICSDFCSDYEVQLFLSATSGLSDS